MRVSDLINKFLQSLNSHAAPTTVTFYATPLRKLLEQQGSLRVAELTPSLVYQWIDRNWPNNSPSTKHAAARSVVRLCNWAVEEHLIEVSPIPSFRKPPPSSREIVLTPTQYAECVKASKKPFRAVVKFLWHTGCRPQELRAIEGSWAHGRKIVFPLARSKGKRKRRVLYLDPLSAGLITNLRDRYPVGPLFRNSHGNHWTKNGLALAFTRLRQRVGIEGLCAYAFRHTFITRHLENGTDIATVAALAGNSPRMVLDIYGHVAANEKRLLAQLD